MAIIIRKDGTTEKVADPIGIKLKKSRINRQRKKAGLKPLAPTEQVLGGRVVTIRTEKPEQFELRSNGKVIAQGSKADVVIARANMQREALRIARARDSAQKGLARQRAGTLTTSGSLIQTQTKGAGFSQAVENLPPSVFKAEIKRQIQAEKTAIKRFESLSPSEKKALSNFRVKEKRADLLLKANSKKLKQVESDLRQFINKLSGSKKSNFAKDLFVEISTFYNPISVADISLRVIGPQLAKFGDTVFNKDLRRGLNKIEGKTRNQALKDSFKQGVDSLKISASENPSKFTASVVALAIMLIISPPAVAGKTTKASVKTSTTKIISDKLKISLKDARSILSKSVKQARKLPVINSVFKSIEFNKKLLSLSNKIIKEGINLRKVKRQAKKVAKAEKKVSKQISKLKAKRQKAKQKFEKRQLKEQQKIFRFESKAIIPVIKKSGFTSGIVNAFRVEAGVKKVLKEVTQELNSIKRLEKLRLKNNKVLVKQFKATQKRLEKEASRLIVTKNSLRRKAFLRKIKSFRARIKKFVSSIELFVKKSKSRVELSVAILRKAISTFKAFSKKKGASTLRSLKKLLESFNKRVKIDPVLRELSGFVNLQKELDKLLFKNLSKALKTRIKSEKDLIKALRVGAKLDKAKPKKEFKKLVKKRQLKAKKQEQKAFSKLKKTQKKKSNIVEKAKQKFKQDKQKEKAFISFLKLVKKKQTVDKLKSARKGLRNFVNSLGKRSLNLIISEEKRSIARKNVALRSLLKQTNKESKQLAKLKGKTEKVRIIKDRIAKLRSELDLRKQDIANARNGIRLLEQLDKKAVVSQTTVNLINSFIKTADNVKKKVFTTAVNKVSKKKPDSKTVKSFEKKKVSNSDFRTVQSSQNALITIDKGMEVTTTEINKQLTKNFGFGVSPTVLGAVRISSSGSVDVPKGSIKIRITNKPKFNKLSRSIPSIKIKPIRRVTSKRQPRFISKGKPKAKARAKIEFKPKSKPKARAKPKAKPRSIIKRKVTPKPKLRLKKPPRRRRGFIKIPDLKKSRILRSRIKKQLAKVKSKFSPSLVAVVENIKSTKKPEFITGAEIRPIIIKLINKKKSRSRK